MSDKKHSNERMNMKHPIDIKDLVIVLLISLCIILGIATLGSSSDRYQIYNSDSQPMIFEPKTGHIWISMSPDKWVDFGTPENR